MANLQKKSPEAKNIGGKKPPAPSATAAPAPSAAASAPSAVASTDAADSPPREHGGPKGIEPTRYGDWEKNGRCSDF